MTGDGYWAAKTVEAARKRPLAFAAWLIADYSAGKLIGLCDRLSDDLRVSADVP